MNQTYKDESDHHCCEKCGFCIECGDCNTHGCGKVEVSQEDKLKWAYCSIIGSDSIVGLDSCDDYKDWYSSLGSK